MPSTGLLILPAIVSTGVLILGQLLLKPRQFIVERPDAPAAPVVEAHSAVDSQPAPPPVEAVAINRAAAPVSPSQASGRVISVVRGKAMVAVDDWPIQGSAQAPHIIVHLYDYTCPDCRHVHGLLRQAREHFGQQLAVLAVPVPLEKACNPLVEHHDPKHDNACFYVRLTLAMWKLNPAKFEALDRWLYDPVVPPPAVTSLAFARDLAGSAIDRAMADPGLDRLIEKSVVMLKAVGGGKLPKLLLPQVVVWGRVPTAGDLIRVLKDQLYWQPASIPARRVVNERLI
jgi:hypothetical protein